MLLNIEIIGHVGADCVLRNHNGKEVLNFSVAHTEKFKKVGGEDVERTTWLNCSMWRGADKLAEYIKKGCIVYCKGMPDFRHYKDKSGADRVEVSCTVDKIKIIQFAKNTDEAIK